MDESTNFDSVFSKSNKKSSSDNNYLNFLESLNLDCSINKSIMAIPNFKKEIYAGMFSYTILYYMLSRSFSLNSKLNFLIPGISLAFILLIISKPLVNRNRMSLYYFEKQNLQSLYIQIEIPWKYSTILGSVYIIFESFMFGSVDYIAMTIILIRNLFICLLGSIIITNYYANKINFKEKSMEEPLYIDSFWKVSRIPTLYILIIFTMLGVINNVVIWILNNTSNNSVYFNFLILRAADLIFLITSLLVVVKRKRKTSILKENLSLYQLLSSKFDQTKEVNNSQDYSLEYLQPDRLLTNWFGSIEQNKFLNSMILTDFPKFTYFGTIRENIKMYTKLYPITDKQKDLLFEDIEKHLPHINLRSFVKNQNNKYLFDLHLLLAYHFSPKILYIQNLDLYYNQVNPELLNNLLEMRTDKNIATYYS